HHKEQDCGLSRCEAGAVRNPADWTLQANDGRLCFLLVRTPANPTRVKKVHRPLGYL
ncbi:Teneurin-2, partial [Manis pentadactyla]